MKKYWQLLVITVVIVATIGGHYIQIAKAATNTVDISFDKLSGDDKYVDTLIIEGGYEGRGSYMPIVITKDGTKLTKGSFFHQTPLAFKPYIQSYKGFMRGKQLSGNNFYEDDNYLAYSAVKDEANLVLMSHYTITVDILDKKTQKPTSFTVQVEQNNGTNWITTESIGIFNNQLKLLLRHSKNTGDDELHYVMIDLKQQKLQSTSELETSNGTETKEYRINIFNDYYHFEQEKYVAYTYSVYDLTSDTFDFETQSIKVLNYDTNEVTEVPLPKDIEMNLNSGIVSNNYFAFVNATPTNYTIYSYNIETNEWQAPKTYEFPFKVLDDRIYHMQVLNGKIYYMTEIDKGFYLTVLDFATGETVYEGVLESPTMNDNYTLYISNFLEQND